MTPTPEHSLSQYFSCSNPTRSYQWHACQAGQISNQRSWQYPFHPQLMSLSKLIEISGQFVEGSIVSPLLWVCSKRGDDCYFFEQIKFLIRACSGTYL
jgi:hypothetical protein